MTAMDEEAMLQMNDNDGKRLLKKQHSNASEAMMHSILGRAARIAVHPGARQTCLQLGQGLGFVAMLSRLVLDFDVMPVDVSGREWRHNRWPK